MLTCMADACVKDLDANFMSFWRRDFDIFDREWLRGSPCDSGLRCLAFVSPYAGSLSSRIGTYYGIPCKRWSVLG